MLKHLLILSSGYILVLMCCLIYVVIKCVNCLKVRNRQNRNEMDIGRRENPLSIEMGWLHMLHRTV